MNLYLLDQTDDLYEGTKVILEERCHYLSRQTKTEGQICLQAVKQDENILKVIYSENTARIYYQDKAHYFRGLGLLLQHMGQGDFTLEEIPQFETNGAMLDCSRNAVLTVEGIKKYIRAMAILGMNRFMIYTEDTYEVKEYPYFGYMRGRYSAEELKQCDDYAQLFGIEIIPCIQTLAHLKTTLKWQYAKQLKDTEDILMVGEEKVYDFISAMIRNASAPFRSKKIHLGMDEAHALGLGNYLYKHGFAKRFDIMKEHLDRLMIICEEQKLEPMIWSDMYFRLNSARGEYYDIPKEADFRDVLKPPQGMGMVYWDYYHVHEAFYQHYIKLHQQLSNHVLFAGGGWTWNGVAPNYGTANQTSNIALKVCKEMKIKDVICTFWLDNGSETPLCTSLPLLTLFAEHGFVKEIDMEKVKQRFSACFNGSWDSFLVLNEFDETVGSVKDNLALYNPSKWLFYQDVLTGLFDGQIKGLGLKNYYEKLAKKLIECKKKNKKYAVLFEYYEVLAKLLSKKCELGIELKDAYEAQNKWQLAKLADEVIPDCIEYVTQLKELREEVWFAENKPFGFEVLDIRYSGVKARLESSQKRVKAYLEGKITSLEELEAERLPYVVYEGESESERKLCACNLWENIVSAGTI